MQVEPALGKYVMWEPASFYWFPEVSLWWWVEHTPLAFASISTSSGKG